MSNGNHPTVKKNARKFESSMGKLWTNTGVYVKQTNGWKGNRITTDKDPEFNRVEKQNGSEFSDWPTVLQTLEAMRSDLNQFKETVNLHFLDMHNALTAEASHNRP